MTNSPPILPKEHIEAIERKVIEYSNHFRASDERAFFRKALEEIAASAIAKEQKRIEQRKGWRGYVFVDPENGYTLSGFYLHRKDIVAWKKKSGLKGKIIEVEIYPAQILGEAKI